MKCVMMSNNDSQMTHEAKDEIELSLQSTDIKKKKRA